MYNGGMKKAKYIFIIVSLIIAGGALTARGVSAVSDDIRESNTVPVSFTFEPADTVLTVKLDGSAVNTIALSDLDAGSASASSDYTISVVTNNAYGYTLSATVGDGTTYTDNTLKGSSGSFTSLATDASLALANFQDNYWGYSIDSNANHTYSGLPYKDGTAKVLNKTKDSAGTAYDSSFIGTTNTTFRIGAKAAITQPAGTYQNVINFSVVVNAASENS